MAQASSLNALEILLVEDNPNDTELALRAPKKHNLGNKVHWVKDGEEALDFLFVNGPFEDRESAPNPRVVLLDLKLPKVDGLEVLRQVRENEKTKLIPVVVLTSSKEEQDVVNSY
jgi:CheY-like chemotaxis protein